MWLSSRRIDSDDGTAPTGVMSWARPTLSTIPEDGFNDLLLPSGVSVIKERTCGNVYQGDMFLVGGFTQNLRLTTGFLPWIQGITAPSTPLAAGSGSGNIVGVAAVTGPGLTADVIVYISWWDEVTQETSPLSVASPTVTLVDQLIAVTNIPTSKPEDDFKIVGSTSVSASASVTGSGTTFLSDIRPGDQIAVSTAPTTFTKVLTVTSDTALTVATAIGAGGTQRIVVRRLMRPTHVRIWYSVDGGLPRVAAQRQVGVTSVTPNILTIGDLGEAFTEDFDKFPKCKYSVEYHDRQYMSGDEQHPDFIYCSLIGLPERRSTIELKTKSGAPVTGLYKVRDTLYVGLAQGHDVITGYTEDDIQINSVAPNLLQQPGLGLTCHFGVGITPDGNAFIPTQYGPYLCDGSSFFPLNQKIRRVWTDDFANRPQAYQDTFCYVDAVRHVYALWLGEHPLIPQGRTTDTSALTGTTTANLDTEIVGTGTAFEDELSVGDQISLSSDATNFATVLEITDDENLEVDVPIGDGTSQSLKLRDETLLDLNAYLVLDYKSVLPLEGGGMGQPRLSWDTQYREDEFASVLLMPGARSGAIITGSCDGSLYRRNVASDTDDSGDQALKRMYIVGSADDFGDVGGDFLHSKKHTSIELYAQCEYSLFTLQLFAGDEEAWPSANSIGAGNIYAPPSKQYNRLGSSLLRAAVTVNNVQFQGTYAPKSVYTIPFRNVSGRRLTLAIIANKPLDFRYFGYTSYWTEGAAPRRFTKLGG